MVADRLSTTLNGIVDDWLVPAKRNAIVVKYGSIGEWDVSQVTNFDNLFCALWNSDFKTFDADISKWNTAAAETMSAMFTAASSFDSDVSKWQTGKVTDMGSILAHGSIVCREYGIPGVLGVGNGTQRIRHGQTITIDGDVGVRDKEIGGAGGSPEPLGSYRGSHRVV